MLLDSRMPGVVRTEPLSKLVDSHSLGIRRTGSAPAVKASGSIRQGQRDTARCPQTKHRRCCVACGHRSAVTLHKLKIRMPSSKPGWTLPLCQPCFALVLPLGPVAELLWFQSMGVDALSAASRGNLPAGDSSLEDRTLLRRGLGRRRALFGGRSG